MFMNRLLKTSSITGSASVPIACWARARPHPRELDRAGCRQGRAPAGLDDRGRVALGDDRRAVDHRARRQRFAHEEAGLEPAPGVHAHARVRRRRGGRGDAAGAGRDMPFTGADGLDRDRLDHQRAVGHQEGEALAIGALEGLADVGKGRAVDDQRGVGALVADVHAPVQLQAAALDPLVDQLARGIGTELRESRLGSGQAGLVERLLDARLAHRDLVRQTHAVGRQHAGQRVDEHALHAQRVGHQAGMLSTRAAEALQRVLRDVVAARDRDALDRVRHVLHGDLQEALGQRLGARFAPGARAHLGRHRLELREHPVAVERLVGLRAEHLREMRRLDLAEHHVGIGHRERPATAVARRPGVRARALGADTQARTVEAEDRSAAGGDGVDAHHRRAHANARHLGLESALEFAGVVAHVGRGAAHVEADDLAMAAGDGGAHHADDAAGRARQDRVLALEAMRLGQAPAGLHEEQAHAGHLRGDLVDVAAQDRRQVGVDHRGVPARDQLHQRTDLVTRADLAEADRAGQARGRLFVRAEAPAVHEDDRAGADAGVEGGLQLARERRLVERLQHLALRAHALLGLGDALVQQLGQHDAALESFGRAW
jgi:hypothetical protein